MCAVGDVGMEMCNGMAMLMIMECCIEQLAYACYVVVSSNTYVKP